MQIIPIISIWVSALRALIALKMSGKPQSQPRCDCDHNAPKQDNAADVNK
jgi:hypothetical protein